MEKTPKWPSQTIRTLMQSWIILKRNILTIFFQTQISDRKDSGVIAYVYGVYKDTFGASKYNPKFDEFFSSLSVMDWSVE